MAETIKKHIKRAEATLEANRSGPYTMPAQALYPHQWNWDSGFIAIGYSRYDTGRAMAELRSLFSAQWRSGMLPQIVFDKAHLGRYFPEPDFWQTELSTDAPNDALTSGITMPPIHALAALRIYENAREPGSVLPFLKWLFPKLLNLHRYLYRERDPESTGLVYIRHPWESGMDNSPMWDLLLKDIEITGIELPTYERKDLSTVSSEMRPAVAHYDRFVYLIELFKKLRYDERAMARESPFLVCGPLFNAVLSASNEALIKLADILGEPCKEPEEWYTLTSEAVSQRLFHIEHGAFDYYDLRGKRLLEVDSAAGFLPLFGGAATEGQAALLYKRLNSISFCAMHQGNCFSIPNYDTQKPGFDRKNYWRGPVWININWMLREGLKRYGFTQKADSVGKDILELPIRFGFHEYYDSFDGRGYGSSGFSWTAALFIDTAFDTVLKTGEVPLKKKLGKVLLTDRVLNTGPSQANTTPKDLPRLMRTAIEEIKLNFYTQRGTVDYSGLRRSTEYSAFKALSRGLGRFDPALLSDDSERLAFWINLYNSLVVDAIISLKIESSVKEAPGFFTRVKYALGDLLYSPDDIEHGILRANSRPPMRALRRFGPFDRRRALSLKVVDPRVHFTLVCGSRSCAPIRFYTPENINDELEEAARNFVNSSEIIVIPEENKAVISMIFNWYEGDFGGRDGVLGFICRYLADDDKREFLERARDSIRIEYLYYDWNLNT